MTAEDFEDAYERLLSLRANLPERDRIPEWYVIEYHQTLDDLTEATGRDLSKYRIRENELSRDKALFRSGGGGLRHTRGRRCDGRLLKMRLDAVGRVFAPGQPRPPIGFRS